MKIFRPLLFCVMLSVLSVPSCFGQANIQTVSSQDIVKAVTQAKGKVVLINFWASWCGPCREEIPALIELRKRIPEDKLLILGISLDADPADVASFTAKAGFNYPVYKAADDVPQAFSIQAIPRTVVYSPTGEMVESTEGAISPEDLERLIARAMGS